MPAISQLLQEGFAPFQDRQEHTLEPCQQCQAKIVARQTNGAAVADDNSNITGAFFLNLWLCRQCYEGLDIEKIKWS